MKSTRYGILGLVRLSRPEITISAASVVCALIFGGWSRKGKRNDPQVHKYRILPRIFMNVGAIEAQESKDYDAYYLIYKHYKQK